MLRAVHWRWPVAVLGSVKVDEDEGIVLGNYEADHRVCTSPHPGHGFIISAPRLRVRHIRQRVSTGYQWQLVYPFGVVLVRYLLRADPLSSTYQFGREVQERFLLG